MPGIPSTIRTPVSSPSPTTFQQAGAAFTGQSAPFLPQVLQPIPDPMVLRNEFSRMFPEANSGDPFQFYNQTQQALAGLAPTPLIQAPTVAPVQVAFPQGNYAALAQAQYEGQFQPVQRELERREGQQTEALQAQLAQAGLASSGTGVGQMRRVGEEFDEQLGAASSAIAGQAQQRALEAWLTVATQQANIDIQRNLANAQLDYASQNSNARNILERGAFEANALTAALGLDAQRVDTLRGQFVQFVDSQTRAALGQSEVARAALADIFNAILQDQATALRRDELTQQRELQTRQMNISEQQGLAQIEQGQQQLGLNARQIAVQDAASQRQFELGMAQANQPDRRLQYSFSNPERVPVSPTAGIQSAAILGSGGNY